MNAVVLVCGVLVCFSPLIGWMLATGSLRHRFKKPSSAAVAVATLLRSDPAGWLRGQHIWSHPVTGVNIWVGNEEYALRWWLGAPQGYNVSIPPPQDRRHVYKTLLPIMQHTTDDIARVILARLHEAPVTDSAVVVPLHGRVLK